MYTRSVALLAILVVLSANEALGQSSTAMISVARHDSPRGLGFMSSANPWVGGQVSVKLTEPSNTRADAIVVTGYLYYKVEDFFDGHLQLPVRGNIAALQGGLVSSTSAKDSVEAQIQSIVASNEGACVGLFPYYSISGGDKITFVPNGILAFKTNALATTPGNVENVNQFVGAFALETHVGRKDKFTASAAVTWHVPIGDGYFNVFHEDKTILGGEFTTVLPIGKGFGVLAEVTKAEGHDVLFRMSVVSAREVKKQNVKKEEQQE